MRASFGRRFRTAAAVLCTAASGIGIWQGCSVYDASLLLYPDGGSEASSDVTQPPDAGDGCNHATWPGRPDASDDAPDDVELYQAIRTLDFGAGDGGAAPTKVVGYDLDGVCTCPGLDTCKPFGEAGTQCDLEGGVDNSGGALIKEFSGSTNFFDQGYINSQIAAGVFGAIFRVQKYNGQANDTNVQISIFVSNGTEGAGTDAGPSIPTFQGNDVWTIDPGSLLGGTITDAGPVPNVAYDLNAYVNDYTLVANISDMPLAIGAATGEGLVTIDLTDAVVVAKLAPLGNGTFSATGTVTGRWESRKLLTALQVLHDPFDFDASLCGSDTIYQLLKDRICNDQDIASNLLDDNKGAPCSALSIAFAFESVPAKYGSVFAKPDAGSGCGPQWTDQCGP
jgi:hypothetical protein